MTATAGMLLVNRILPLIAAAIAKGAVKATGCEDREELVAEGCALAAKALESLEVRGKDVPANSVAFYAIERLKGGRRSGYAGKADVLSAAATISGRVNVHSMDQSVGVAEDDPYSELTLHDVLADGREDGSTEAARRIDWDAALATMDARMQGIVLGTATEVGTGKLAGQYRISPARVCQVREAAGTKIAAAWGGEPVADVTREAGWRKHVRTYAERRACRYARARR